jgi:thiol-disulfide isomerase/thioredoxin
MRLITVLLLSTFPFLSGAQGISIDLTGMIFNSGEDSIYISQFFGDHYEDIRGTKFDKDGNFNLAGQLDNEDYYVLRFGNNHINLILRDKSSIKVYGDGANITQFANILGSDESKSMNEYLILEKNWQQTLDSANALIANDPSKRSAVNRDMNNEYKKFQGLQKSFVSRHPNSAALLPVLNSIDMNNDFASYDAIVTQLSTGFGGSPTVKELKVKFDIIKTEKIKNDPMAPGKPAPGFTEAYANGDLLSLSDLKGSVVLLDFWASWCGPCRRENPNVVKLYKKYKEDGFTVLSVSLDKTKAPWLAAIEKDELIWPYHVSDLGGWNSKVPKLYGVKGIPFTVLIDKEGNIVRTKLRGPELETELARIFGH